ncbi:MAG: D-alanyl-D-alanine carboxypeptidase [Desulfobacterales bacterium]|nr:D-alanyl-D-alanine carboxypeptidase [Desulfobacterales bacterium]
MTYRQYFTFIFIFTSIVFIGLTTDVTYAAKKSNPPTKSQVKSDAISKSPYLGAICIDAATGKILFEDNPDAKAYPASVIKLMNLLIILDQLNTNAVTLDTKVTITAESARIGGSQVYLKENEVFTIEDLLYALMVQSANDAATALALHVAGSKEGFVEMMNQKAKQIDMTNTVFNSVHGLPPSKNQEPDVCTPRDMAKLCMELLKYPNTLKYTSVVERPFRTDMEKPFIMRNHNHLLNNFEGCDGFKTGYYTKAGFSIAATASRKGVRAIAVVMGCTDRKERDAKAKELLSKGLIELAKTASVASATPAGDTNKTKTTDADAEKTSKEDYLTFQLSKSTLIIAVVIVVLIILLLVVLSYMRKPKRKDKYM